MASIVVALLKQRHRLLMCRLVRPEYRRLVFSNYITHISIIVIAPTIIIEGANEQNLPQRFQGQQHAPDSFYFEYEEFELILCWEIFDVYYTLYCEHDEYHGSRRTFFRSTNLTSARCNSRNTGEFYFHFFSCDPLAMIFFFTIFSLILGLWPS